MIVRPSVAFDPTTRPRRDLARHHRLRSCVDLPGNSSRAVPEAAPTRTEDQRVALDGHSRVDGDSRCRRAQRALCPSAGQARADGGERQGSLSGVGSSICGRAARWREGATAWRRGRRVISWSRSPRNWASHAGSVRRIGSSRSRRCSVRTRRRPQQERDPCQWPLTWPADNLGRGRCSRTPRACRDRSRPVSVAAHAAPRRPCAWATCCMDTADPAGAKRARCSVSRGREAVAISVGSRSATCGCSGPVRTSRRARATRERVTPRGIASAHAGGSCSSRGINSRTSTVGPLRLSLLEPRAGCPARCGRPTTGATGHCAREDRVAGPWPRPRCAQPARTPAPGVVARGRRRGLRAARQRSLDRL